MGAYIVGLLSSPFKGLWAIAKAIWWTLRAIPRALAAGSGAVIAVWLWVFVIAQTSHTVGNVYVVSTPGFFWGLAAGIVFGWWYYFTYAFFYKRYSGFRRWMNTV